VTVAEHPAFLCQLADQDVDIVARRRLEGAKSSPCRVRCLGHELSARKDYFQGIEQSGPVHAVIALENPDDLGQGDRGYEARIVSRELFLDEAACAIEL